MRTRVSRLFWRYLIYYFVVLLIPVAVLGTFAQAILIRQLRDSATAQVTTQLAQRARLIDEVFQEVQIIAHQMWASPELRPFQYENDPYHARVAVNTIRRYRNTSRFIDELGLHFRNDMYVYSGAGAQSLEYFFTTTPAVQSLSYPGFLLLLRSVETRHFVAGNDSLAVVLPYPLSTRVARRIFIVTMRTSEMADELVGPSVAQLEIATGTSGRFFLRRVTPDADLTDTLTIEHVSPISGWTYSFVLPRGHIDRSTTGVRGSFLVTVLLTLLFGFLLVLVLAFRNYVPIREIRTLVHQFDQRDDTLQDELVDIRESVRSLGEHGRHMRSQLAISTPALRESVTLHLLNGGIVEREMLDASGMKLDHARIHVIVAYVPTQVDQDAGSLEHLRNEMRDTISYAAGETEAVVIDRRRLAILVGCPSRGEKHFQHYVSGLHVALRERLGGPLTLGVSDTKESPREVPEAYIEAATAVDYRVVLGQGRVIYFNETRDATVSNFPYPYELLSRLDRCLHARDVAGIRETAQQIREVVCGSSPSLFVARRLYYRILDLMWGEFTHLIPREGAARIPGTLIIERVDSIEEMMRLMFATIEEFLRYASEVQDETPDAVAAIKEYIESDFQNPELSLVTLSDRFGRSPNYLSAAFKKSLQMNLSDFIGVLRIDLAKRLLRETDSPVAEIVTDVGYSDTSSFIRKFKAVVGTTPGAYRRIHRSASPDGDPG